MRTPILVSVIFLCASALWAQDSVVPLNVKLGLWETTTTTTMSGMPPIPADVLAKMTPEQRARMEQMMAARSGAGKADTRKSCMTADKLHKAPFSDDRKNCTYNVVSSSSIRWEVHFSCVEDKGNMKMNGVVRVEALSSDSAKGSVEVASEGGDHKMNISNTFSSKWLGPDCGDVK